MTPEQFAEVIKVLKDIDTDLIIIGTGIFMIFFCKMFKK